VPTKDTIPPPGGSYTITGWQCNPSRKDYTMTVYERLSLLIMSIQTAISLAVYVRTRKRKSRKKK
ncbi:MAG: hypothetical protein LBN12_06025, partial [Clostridiales Family XIII bacterium]|nr:hypothetical protein [Clostridiales Family XIII bacterium]